MLLKIEAFRGVNQPFELKFDTKRHLTVLYGENGCGKTTIADAFEFLFKGTAGSLEEKSVGAGAKTNRLVHLERKKADLKVSFTEQNQTRSATLSGTKPNLTGSVPSRLQVLSRKNVSKLIDETPAKRYERIQEFVEVPALEREEKALRDLVNSEKTRQKSQLALIGQSEDRLSELHQQHDPTAAPDQRNQWLKSVLAESDETTAEHLTILTDLKQEITSLRNDFTPLKDSYQSVDIAEKKLKEEEDALKKATLAHSGDLANAVQTLQQAKDFLSKDDADLCPVCDTEIGHATLAQKVDEKLSRLSALSSQAKKHETAKQALTKAHTTQETLQKTYFGIIQRLSVAQIAAVETEQWDLPELVAPLLGLEDPSDLSSDWFDGLTAVAGDLKPLAELVEKSQAALQLRNDLQKQIRSALKLVKDNTREGKAIDFTIQRAEAIGAILRARRIAYANTTLNSIAEDFAKLYSTLHPQEDLEKIRLFLDPKQKSSANLSGHLFGKEDASPVAYLSESHLDTLALCLFIALQKRNEPEKTILYLDDAIASVDEAHMERLYHLLLDQAQHFRHVIISSHYQPLRFKFRWGLLTNSGVDFVELGQWSLEKGITHSKGPNSEIKLLRKYVDAADDASTIAAKSGLVLERILDFLTGIYQCRLPRNPGSEQRWTLGHYHSGLKGEKKLLGSLRCDHLDDEGTVIKTAELSPLLEDIFNRLEVRNAVGCHFKELAGHFDETTEATALGNATLALVEALCDEQDTLPDRKKDGCSWHNRGNKVTRRLYPLLKPE
ncbi:MAG: energy-coupling factor transporter ATP-binding protein EcfA2 [Akkermansiaceae bacterium]|jgi:energy-coupling factor transporter ATP-binding protein EcfA2